MAYFRKRLVHLVPVFFLVTFASFVLVNLLPGDVVDAILADDQAANDPELRRQIMVDLGLDKPLLVRYFTWLGDLAQGDLGRSYITGKKIGDLLVQRIPVTLQLMVMSLAFALVVAVPLGILCAYRSNRAIDRWISGSAFGIVATPPFVTSILFVWVFAVILKALPAAGHAPMFMGVSTNLKYFILPMLAIGLSEVPIFLRVLRVDMITTLQEDYIALAKAKGMSTGYILFRHALRPSMFTLVTVLGLQVGRLISGLVIVENIFALPGIGKLLIDAIDARDVLVVQAIVTFSAIAYVVINLTVDILYAVLDPRVGRRPEAV
ncbi:MAG: ABC transporter permease [Rhodobacteraceae bacterium]|nr:ABC transporter permease [Paracoccaceae bacterium]MCY4138785.1 ABC transporter permease [Paracoccaceae bacterium]